jgi:Na+/H+-translocating membrane pyrophosphatase
MSKGTAQGVVEIGGLIHEGASEFITSEYKYCAVFMGVIAVVVWGCVDGFHGIYTTFAFLVGAATSMGCGALGMHVATYSNFRTTICAKISLGYAFKTAYRAGVVIGFALVAFSILILLLLVTTYQTILGLDAHAKTQTYYTFLL